MFAVSQWENSPVDSMNSEISRIITKKYSEVADYVRIAKGLKKSEVAKMAKEFYPDYGIEADQVYEWFEGKGDPRTSFSKIMEHVLGINLPAQCYYNAGKR